MADNFEDLSPALDSPGSQHKQIVPHDTNPVSPKPRALYCRVAGDVVVKDPLGVALTYTMVAREILPFRGHIIMATGTTATLYGWD